MNADVRRIRHDELRDRDADERQPHHQPEDAGNADEIGDDRPGEQRNEERGADGNADHGHSRGSAILTGEIGNERQNDRTNGAGSLQRPADNDAADRGGDGGDRTASSEQCKPENYHDLAPDPVGQQAKWNLQQTLAETVDAERFADQVRIGVGERAGIGREYRIDHEQAEEPDRKHGRERRSGPEFLRFHYDCWVYDRLTAGKWRPPTEVMLSHLLAVNCGSLSDR